jgi:NAD(P)-dependent dehydrogenase (short-subunit alcohol dehydrogenase family)
VNLLEGKSALITGCGSGIGRASALAFARASATVTCADVDQKGWGETVDLIREAHGKAKFVQADMTDAKQVRALIARIVTAHGRLDCAFNNAIVEGDVIELHEVSERNFGVADDSVWPRRQ